jgi:hypothetical protein
MQNRVPGLAVVAALTSVFAVAQTAEVKTAEQVYKNIVELKGIPAEQVQPTMQFIAASLGVQCTFCHVRDKDELDDKKPKKDARKMIAMTLAINKGHFEGNLQVTCFTCHQGSTRANGIPPWSKPTRHRAANVAGVKPHPLAAHQVAAADRRARRPIRLSRST